ncbi:unnamed protein product [Parascedosporium putredinis]|uniref:Uncharacterized protein n=1 Tax=Parascedosporium putredinis TaxID=1442378 RepID=A0A9P1H127_9PEZI|nr:unnamed protein product [Parascedosporium putredinis]CAI7992645.1 unnamed protein product [Parascedosporium putredinis]
MCHENPRRTPQASKHDPRRPYLNYESNGGTHSPNVASGFDDQSERIAYCHPPAVTTIPSSRGTDTSAQIPAPDSSTPYTCKY